MRRKIGRILAPVMAAMLVFGGCGNKTSDRVTENQTHKTENESNEPVEKEPAEDEDELKEENQEEQNTQDQETDVEEEEEKAEIPEESTLDINYTSVDGLRMEKGSRISVVIKNTESDYWKAAKKGMEQAVCFLCHTLCCLSFKYNFSDNHQVHNDKDTQTSDNSKFFKGRGFLICIRVSSTTHCLSYRTSASRTEFCIRFDLSSTPFTVHSHPPLFSVSQFCSTFRAKSLIRFCLASAHRTDFLFRCFLSTYGFSTVHTEPGSFFK